MKVTCRTFIRFHTRCTKNKPDSVSLEIAARKRWRRRNIWNLYSCCRNTQGGSRVIYLCIMCPERNHSPPGSHLLLHPCSVLQGSAQCQSSAGIGERNILFQPKLSYEELSETEKCPFWSVFSPTPGQKKCVVLFFTEWTRERQRNSIWKGQTTTDVKCSF